MSIDAFPIGEPGAGPKPADPRGIPRMTTDRDDRTEDRDILQDVLSNVALPLAVFTGPNAICVYANGAFLDLLGFAPEAGFRPESIGGEFARRLRHEVGRAMRGAVTTGGGIGVWEKAETSARSGPKQAFAFEVHPGRTHDGNIAVTVTANDVTAISLGVAALNVDRRRLRLIEGGATSHAVVTMDQSGVVQSWPSGAERVFGIPAHRAIGRSMLQVDVDRVLPTLADECTVARSAGMARMSRQITRPDGAPASILGTVHDLREKGYLMVVHDATSDEEAGERLQDALLRLDLELEGCRTNGDAFAVASAFFKKHLQTALAGFYVTDTAFQGDDGIVSDAQPGVAEFLDARREVLQAAILTYGHAWTGNADATRSPDRSETALDPMADGFLVASVEASGECVALAYACLPGTSEPDPTVVSFTKAVAKRVGMALARLESLGREREAARELVHRLSNQMQLVQAVAARTLIGDDLGAARESLAARLAAMTRAHASLLRDPEHATLVRRVVELTLLDVFGSSGFSIEGGEARLTGPASGRLSMVLFELATNACKHGALRHVGGRIAVSWQGVPECEGGGLALRWRESGGPDVLKSNRTGSGTKIIKSGVSGPGTVALDFRREGLLATFRIAQTDIVG